MDDSQAPRGRLDARYRAFLETIAALRPKLHRYCARMIGSTLDGEDVVQDALFDAYRHLDTYDERRPIGPWLFRIAHNRCIDVLRRREVRAQAEDAAAEPPLTAAVDPLGPAVGRAVEHLVQHLPPKERACVLLKDVFDYTIEEIADLVDSTPGGVKAALHRGREKLAALPLPSPAPARPAPVMREDEERLLRLYVERFNQRDWDGLRALIAADATLRVADLFEGLLRESRYFTHYAELPVPAMAALVDVDGQTALALRPETAASPRSFVRIVFDAGRIVHISDYGHCSWMVDGALHVSPIRARA
jgi:RNA polymerase sigma-70 factor (ECF subfamily)